MYYYCLVDVHVTRRQPGHGFANTKEVIALCTKKARDNYVKDRSDFDYSCRALLRSEAIKFAKPGWFGKYAKISKNYGVLLTLNSNGKIWPKQTGKIYPFSEL